MNRTDAWGKRRARAGAYTIRTIVTNQYLGDEHMDMLSSIEWLGELRIQQGDLVLLGHAQMFRRCARHLVSVSRARRGAGRLKRQRTAAVSQGVS